MKVIRSADEMSQFAATAKAEQKSIGFVPTMGALHDGHASLIRMSISNCDITVVSVFVNPTQFNQALDLESYPRTFGRDKALLESLGVDAMFFPTVEEIYPTEEVAVYDLDRLDELMEGPNRPGHFKGVVQVVTRLFDIVVPDRSYFGEKDFQQLAILRHMSKKLGYDVQVIGCSTIRESTGLAMSSRNARLSTKDRQASLLIYKVLTTIKQSLGAQDLEEVLHSARKAFEENSLLKLEYLELVNPETLKRSTVKDTSIQACIAVWAGDVRLIDNMRVK